MHGKTVYFISWHSTALSAPSETTECSYSAECTEEIFHVIFQLSSSIQKYEV